MKKGWSRRYGHFAAAFVCTIWLCLRHGATSCDASEERALGSDAVNGRVTVEERLPLPAGYHEGIMMRNGEIWVANGKGKPTWRIDRRTGARVGDVKVPGSFTEAMVDEGAGTILITDWEEKAIYRTRLEGDELQVVSRVSVEPEYPAGMTVYRDDIWVITWALRMNTVYFLYRFDRSLTLIEKMTLDGIKGPAHMASDGRYLWITAWYGGSIHLFDPKSKEIVATYPSPVTDATGIAFEDGSIWITGTSSDLYRIRIDRSG